MHEWTNEWMNQPINQWFDQPINRSKNEYMHKWIKEYMNTWMNKSTNEWINDDSPPPPSSEMSLRAGSAVKRRFRENTTPTSQVHRSSVSWAYRCELQINLVTCGTAAARLAQVWRWCHCCIVLLWSPKGRVISFLGRFVSQTRGGITRCNYAQSGAALLHEKRPARPNSMSYGLKVYRSVWSAIAHLVIGCTSVTFHSTRSYGDVLYSYKLQVALTSLFYFFYKCTTNHSLRTGHNNVLKFQRLTVRIALRRPFSVFHFGPGWPSTYNV